MRKAMAVSVLLLLMLVCGRSLLRPPTSAAQSPGRKASKKEEFGASLKRLKWNPKKQTAEEVKWGSHEGGPPVEPGGVVRVDTDLVVLDLFVTEQSKSRALTGLGQADFVVTEDGVAQQIAMFSGGDNSDLARSVVLIMDSSSSLSRYLDQSIEAAKTLVNRLGPKDQMAIVNDGVALMVDFTKDKKRLRSALDSLRNLSRRPSRGSRQLSALFATLRELVSVAPGRPVVILQSDGDEIMNLRDQQPRAEEQPSAYEFGLADIHAAVLGTRATIYTLIPGEVLLGIPLDEARRRVGRSMNSSQEEWYINFITPLRVRGQESIIGVAEISGGWAAHLESPERAGELYERILTDLNQRYIIGYYPTNEERDGRLRKVQVEVRGRPEYVVHGRRSYYLLPR